MCWRWEWSSFVPSCRPVSVCGVRRRKRKPKKKKEKKASNEKGENRLLCCNKNTWILSSSYQCWTEFCYIMRKETPSTDVGRVLIIGELRRKQITGGVTACYRVIFISHGTNLHWLLTFVWLWGVGKKNPMKRNKTLNDESAFGTNCTAVAHTFRRGGFRKKKKEEAHALVAGGPVLYLCVLHRAFGLWRQT